MDRIPSLFSLIAALIIITTGLICRWSPETIVIRTLISIALTALLGKGLLKIILSLERTK
ncbi:MAG: hypothetical protein D6734_07995 [Candidatus Schekmanbacteria bacterium]|nr:MAG: hypothetical protein D6734_07995 [Candidatus Schekmanbacteria bacterium]